MLAGIKDYFNTCIRHIRTAQSLAPSDFLYRNYERASILDPVQYLAAELQKVNGGLESEPKAEHRLVIEIVSKNLGIFAEVEKAYQAQRDATAKPQFVRS